MPAIPPHGYREMLIAIPTPAVIQVITIVDVIDIDIIIVVPVISPIGWPWVNKAEPIAAVLEAGVSTLNHERKAANSEPVARPKVSTKPAVGNAISVISATLLPGTVI